MIWIKMTEIKNSLVREMSEIKTKIKNIKLITKK